MKKLMRDNLNTLVSGNISTAHAGLLIQRALPFWEEGDKPCKQTLLATIAAVKSDELYRLAFERWLNVTNDNPDFATLSATINGRLLTGLPLGGTLETGAATHHTYGFPLLAGSAIKGAARHYAQTIGIDAAVIEVLFGSDDDENPQAGYLIWHDAWWIPDTKIAKPFTKDVVTVHHQDYYSGNELAAYDTESPTPSLQVAIQGSFYFAIEGVHAWAKLAKDILERLLSDQGLGSKTASGFGYFDIQDSLLDQHLNKIKSNKQEQQQAEEISKAGSATEAELLTLINAEKWEDNNDVAKTKFSKAIESWLDILEADFDANSAVRLLNIAKIHYASQLKNPAKIKKPAQKAWVDRLLALQNK